VWKLPVIGLQVFGFAKEKWENGDVSAVDAGYGWPVPGPILAMARSNAGRSISQ